MTSSPACSSQWIEVDAESIRSNLGLFRRLIGERSALVAVVKANAYGHGLDQVAPVAARHAQWLAVHSAGEAREIRALGVDVPVLVMGFVPPSELVDLDRDVHLFVSTPEVLEWIGAYRSRTGVALPIHLKVDTGAKRQGVAVDEIAGLCRRAAGHGLEVVGLASHFANIEDTIEHDFARLQLDRFEHAVEVAVTALGGRPAFIHTACSAASLLFRETDFNLVRIGISTYGHWPSRETRLSWILQHGRSALGLRPALTWKAVVGQLQSVGRHETVGYGRTWTALRRTTLAVIPVGYSDGYWRSLGNRSRVLVGGHPAPVVGRVCMNIMMVDVTDVPRAEVGDEVVLIGRQGTETVTAEELALHADTINYELLARLSPSIPRRLVNDQGSHAG